MTEPQPAVDQLNIPVSPGELLDKISILKLKSERLNDARQLEYVNHELRLLEAAWEATGVAETTLAAKIDNLQQQLQTINAQLWEIEDRLRECEAGKNFEAEFIELARSVYLTNDRRAAVKKSINETLGSSLREEKSYSEY